MQFVQIKDKVIGRLLPVLAVSAVIAGVQVPAHAAGGAPAVPTPHLTVKPTGYGPDDIGWG